MQNLTENLNKFITCKKLNFTSNANFFYLIYFTDEFSKLKSNYNRILRHLYTRQFKMCIYK